MYEKYKNSYKVTEKELVSLSVYNVGFQRCDSLYQWGPGIRDHYLIHYIISGKGFYKIGKRTYKGRTTTYECAVGQTAGICKRHSG